MGADIKVFLNQNKLPYLAKPFDIELLKKQIDVIIKAGKPDNDSPNQSGVG